MNTLLYFGPFTDTGERATLNGVEYARVRHRHIAAAVWRPVAELSLAPAKVVTLPVVSTPAQPQPLAETLQAVADKLAIVADMVNDYEALAILDTARALVDSAIGDAVAEAA